MYDIVKNIIDHSYITQGAGDQQYIYFVCGALIIIFSICFIDIVYRVFRHFWR